MLAASKPSEGDVCCVPDFKCVFELADVRGHGLELLVEERGGGEDKSGSGAGGERARGADGGAASSGAGCTWYLMDARMRMSK